MKTVTWVYMIPFSIIVIITEDWDGVDFFLVEAVAFL